MDKSTREALLGSIEKWERIVAGTGEDRGTLNCPLCKKFYFEDRSRPCVRCPVAKKVGNILCRGTPYENYLRAWPEGRPAAAEAELAFLQSLLAPDSGALRRASLDLSRALADMIRRP